MIEVPSSEVEIKLMLEDMNRKKLLDKYFKKNETAVIMD